MVGLKVFKIFLRKTLLNPKNSIVVIHNPISTLNLLEIGRFTEPKPSNNHYETGQLFLNKSLGYRGLILYPWMVPVYDRDVQRDSSKVKRYKSNEVALFSGEEVKFSVENYYQVFIDVRDRSYVRAQIKSINFAKDIQNQNQLLYSIPGIDYVAHEDILPYSVTEKVPFKHELMNRFFTTLSADRLWTTNSGPSFDARDTLRFWHINNFNWFKMTEVHTETSGCVRTTVMPFYMGCHGVKTINIYSWRYIVCFLNISDSVVIIKSHKWRVFGESGIIKTMNGHGVLGQEIVLSKTQPIYQFTSHISLRISQGRMSGSFKAEKDDGSSIEIRVPLFSLESEDDDVSLI